MAKVAVLGAFVLCFALVFSNDIANQPPEDQDGSGDDEDSFSGSGFGVLRQDTVTVSQPEEREPVLTSVSPLASTSDQPAIEKTQSTSEMETTSTAKDLEVDEVLAGSEEIQKSNSTAEESEMKPSSVVTIQTSTTQPTSQASSTTSTDSNVKDVVHHSDSHASTEGTDAPESTSENPSDGDVLSEKGFLPFGNIHTSTAMVDSDGTSPTNITAVENVPVFPEGRDEGSGDVVEEFFFAVTEKENSRNLNERKIHEDSKTSETDGTTDASKGIMDRKEVLGGVIAGGVVGLLFAVFLVGFMLYRMKKKDEGSYSLEEPKHSNGGYQKPQKQEEFYA
ncbi:syndecan-1 [Rhinatrema bivittatum]|uniref:syndecan-1 n=1 Tax=Rhinatrema bivittatum TaxID=194408 RepID=UPI00112960C4|nr:syndecan-1 [Rhinatrema bivittatum]